MEREKLNKAQKPEMPNDNSTEIELRQTELELVVVNFCDLGIKEHATLNANFINSTKRAYKTAVINCTNYLNAAQIIEKTTKNLEDETRMHKVLSGRKILAYFVEITKNNQHIRKAFGKSEGVDNKADHQFTKELGWREQLLNAARVLKTKNHLLSKLTFDGIEIGKHLCIDSSLDLKTAITGLKYKSNKLEWLYLKIKAFYICDAIAKIKKESDKVANKSKILVVSSSVYGMDWAVKDWCNKNHINHIFIEHSPQLRAYGQMAKAYISVPQDILNRRELQENKDIKTNEHLEALNYSVSYLEHRLSPESFHRYSPMRMDLNVALKILKHLKDESMELWTYYSNSPDELISIEHAVDASGMRGNFQYQKGGIAENEYECISLLAKEAKNNNAILAVRIHPRLGKNKRDSQISPELRLMVECCEKAKKENPNVLVILPEERVNSYELAIWSDRYFSFRGTMPLELSLAGLKPLVIAKNKSTMNYWFKLHADMAPNDMKDFYRYISEPAPAIYKLDEIRQGTWQFWSIQAKNCISFADEVEAKTIKKFFGDCLDKSAIEPSNGNHKDISVKNQEMAINLQEKEQIRILERYLQKVYMILKKASC